MSTTAALPIRRAVIAPTVRVAELFIRESGYNPRECRIITTFEHMQGCKLDDWEVWFLQRAWSCRTHAEIERMLEMERYAKHRGADIRHWWT